LVDENSLICLGNGGPAEPHRYCINPMLLTGERRDNMAKQLEPHGFVMIEGVLIRRGDCMYAMKTD
jgi:hypothetical protein